MRRKNSLRLKGYDFSLAGAYFITANIQDNKIQLGDVHENEIILNQAGILMEKWWVKISDKFPKVVLDEFKFMPNHMHGILILLDDSQTNIEQKKKTVGDITLWFKTMSTNEYMKVVKKNVFTPFRKKLWQRDYYDRVIRSERELERIREYIFYNPLYWSWDKEKFEAYLKKNIQ